MEELQWSHHPRAVNFPTWVSEKIKAYILDIAHLRLRYWGPANVHRSLQINMTAQGALCHSLLPSTSCSPSHAFRVPPYNARAFFNGGLRPFVSYKQNLQKRTRSDSTVRNGLFDFLNPGGRSGASDELVSDILEAARTTNGGSKASAQTREEIEELVHAVLTYIKQHGMTESVRQWQDVCG